MKIEISNLQKCETFVALFQHLKQFTDCVNVMFTETEMFIQSMDTGRVLVFEIRLPKEWFDVYESGYGSTIIGVHTSMFYKIMNIRDKTQEIVLETNPNMSHLSILLQKSPTKTIFDKQFELPLMDIEYDLMEIPEIDHQADFSLESSTFATLINQLRIFGETVTVNCTEEHIQLNADSPEHGKMMTNIPIEDLQEYAIEEGETLSISFALKYMHDICLYQKIAKHINLGISANYPMKVQYDLRSTEDETYEGKAEMCFYVAPRINDNDNDV